MKKAVTTDNNSLVFKISHLKGFLRCLTIWVLCQRAKLVCLVYHKNWYLNFSPKKARWYLGAYLLKKNVKLINWCHTVTLLAFAQLETYTISWSIYLYSLADFTICCTHDAILSSRTSTKEFTKLKLTFLIDLQNGHFSTFFISWAIFLISSNFPELTGPVITDNCGSNFRFPLFCWRSQTKLEASTPPSCVLSLAESWKQPTSYRNRAT